MLSSSHRFIFIHVPKTGGNSIQSVLLPFADEQVVLKNPQQDGVDRFELQNIKYGFSKHATLQDYCQHIEYSTLSKLQIFCCVRNPWERMISYFFSPHRGVKRWSREEFIGMLKNEASDLKDYLTQDIFDEEKMPGIQYLQFEKLASEFELLCAKLGIPYSPLPHRNRSNHRTYQGYYDRQLIELVRLKSKFEIDKFGYQFGS